MVDLFQNFTLHIINGQNCSPNNRRQQEFSFLLKMTFWDSGLNRLFTSHRTLRIRFSASPGFGVTYTIPVGDYSRLCPLREKGERDSLVASPQKSSGKLLPAPAQVDLVHSPQSPQGMGYPLASRGLTLK